MELIDFQNYCELLPGTAAGFPFDEETLVYKLHGKVFALTDFHDFSYISLKCEPNDAMVLRQAYPLITAGYHLNKRHWITLHLGQAPDQRFNQNLPDQNPGFGSSLQSDTDLAEGLTDSFIFRLLLNSYYLVLEGLPKRLQQHLPSEHLPDTALTAVTGPGHVAAESQLTTTLQRPGRAQLEAARRYIAAECAPLYL
ncbi:MAG: MmcQ/YjbR family DNA-binding protein, partial [Spirochaetaceae bacterium]|nr:MmcQ/YjbR family DNA-binding protein [Spirochaetaceae bacterium]MCF7951915.1 MmcQ/YjbR family DNA-binding protein [Spirochaetaceae bacterium]